ncbi:uncharacterized protein N0V89_005302 [Didymosphaeria variabile]|uniref:F-box domain-containing protein n=1 Tax=Didymosphaeria variabile TaxID=1932322 RepID=A0A9W9CB31_9PLEO|nr:uncharacterized protein N0V89_005302 [Didymosphaeria variabile]KAJ4353572.1 hypothetical protein N0V89_005302 [Didymosphaeria variabile]
MQSIDQLAFPPGISVGHGAMRPAETKLVLICVKDFFVQTICLKARSLFPKKPQYLPTYPTTTLPGLPNELIRLIASFLPPHAEALLILTCKQLLYTLGTHSWLVVPPLLKERKMFMHLLERDLPNYYGYFYHLRRKLPHSYPSNFVENSKRHYMTDHGWLLPSARFGYAVSWSHVVFALRADSFGALYGIPLDAFAYDSYQRIECTTPEYAKFKKIKETRVSKWSKFNRRREDDTQVQLSARARIVSGHLILRCIYTVSNKKRPANLDDLKTLGLDVCGWAPYDGSGWADRPVPPSQPADLNTTAGTVSQSPDARVDIKETVGLFQTMKDVLRTNADIDYSGRCTFCFTEYSVQEASLEPNNGIEVVVWHDLGDGKSKDGIFWAKNVHWKALVNEDQSHMCTRHYVRPHSIRDAFEDGNGSGLYFPRNIRPSRNPCNRQRFTLSLNTGRARNSRSSV